MVRKTKLPLSKSFTFQLKAEESKAEDNKRSQKAGKA